MAIAAKAKPALLILTILILVGIFLLPDPFVGLRFPFSDEVRIFDGYTKVNFSTREDAAIDDVDLILWPGEREAFQLLLTRADGLGEVMVNGGISPEFEPLDGRGEDRSDGGRSPFSSIPGMNIYLEHYVEIEKTNIGRGPLGRYPDALIPLQLAVFMEMGDASFVTLYVEITTDADVSPGIYTGEIVVNISGDATNIPFRFTVLDIHVEAESLPVAMGVSDMNFSRFTRPILAAPSAGAHQGAVEDIYENFAAHLYDASLFPINFDTLIHPKVKHTEEGMDISFTRMDAAYQFFFADTPAKQFPLNSHDIFGRSGILRGEVFSPEWNMMLR